MKIILVLFLSLLCSVSFSQSLSNKKVVTVSATDILGNINSGRTYSGGVGNSPTKSEGVRINLAASIGRFNDHNVAVLYGLELPVRFTHTSTQNVEANETEYGFFPSVSVLKMLPISGSVYLGSRLGVRAGYQRYRSSISGQNPEIINTWEGRIFYRPFDFIWYFQKETALTFGIWDGYLSYISSTTKIRSSNDASLATHGLTINARFNLTFGMQFLLHH